MLDSLGNKEKYMMSVLSKFEKRLVVFALVFVAIYLGAAAITIHTRITKGDAVEQRFESPNLTPAEGQLLIAELFLPFMIILTLTICFVIVRKQRAKKLLRMEAEEKAEEEFEEHH